MDVKYYMTDIGTNGANNNGAIDGWMDEADDDDGHNKMMMDWGGEGRKSKGEGSEAKSKSLFK